MPLVSAILVVVPLAGCSPSVVPAVAGIAPPPKSVLEGQSKVDLPAGLVRDSEGRIWSEADSMEMVLVPAGEFTMGSSSQPIRMLSRDPEDEMPEHRVTVSAFLIDRVEVTEGQFKRFCAATGRKPPDVSLDHDDLWPMGNVMWEEAKAYAEWAGKSLPTEAEWEKAARGADRRAFPWGNEPPSRERANYHYPSRTDADEYPPRVGTRPEGQSPYGCLDMAGSLREWCADWYGPRYYADSPASDPRGPASGEWRVHRGGAWGSKPEDLRCTSRGGDWEKFRHETFGFRTDKRLTK
jgi:formylglycine-generating enzyme required for sulfatase activity